MIVKVLYVEGELFLGKIVKESLEGRGFQVTMESDGANVLNAFKNIQPDICILDVMLPNKNGFELAAEIRKKHESVPLIFLTAKTQTEDVIRGFKSGGNDFIRKPFSMEELIVRMENVLKRKPMPSYPLESELLQFGAYQLNLKRQTLAWKDKEKKLSYRETELFRFLWLNRENIIDRKKMLQAIWGNDSFFNSRNLDVYIAKLRGYLKDDESVEILTIKGVGYRLVF